MAVQVPAQVRLYPDAEQVSPVGDHEVQKALAHIGHNENGHQDEKGVVGLVGQQIVQCRPGDVGKGQVNEADEKGAAHVQNEQIFVGAVVGEKYF